MKFIKTLLLCFALYAMASQAAANAKYSSIVIDAKSGEILYAEASNKRLHPAGLTKLMTLYIVFGAVENGEVGLDDNVRITRHAASEPPVKLGLRPDQLIRLRYLIRAVAVHGSNDAATAIGEYLDGTEAAFARRMNREAARLQMERTTFKNAHGLTETGHLTTSHDLALLFKAIYDEFPAYFNLFSRINSSTGIRTVKNSARRLLTSQYDIIGAKTGYTRASGYSAAVYKSNRGKSVIVVTFGGRSVTTRNKHIQKLGQLGFKKVRHKTIK